MLDTITKYAKKATSSIASALGISETSTTLGDELTDEDYLVAQNAFNAAFSNNTFLQYLPAFEVERIRGKSVDQYSQLFNVQLLPAPKGVDHMFANDAAAESIGQTTFIFKHRFWEGEGELKTKLYEAAKGLAVNSTWVGGLEATVRHETAHQLWSMILNDEERDAITKLYHERIDSTASRSDRMKAAKEFVTSYAGENPREFFAESFALFTSRDYNKNAWGEPTASVFNQIQEQLYSSQLRWAPTPHAKGV